jgi:hypothetical protein
LLALQHAAQLALHAINLTYFKDLSYVSAMMSDAMDHAEWTATMRTKIARLRLVARKASDEEAREALHDIVKDLDAEIDFMERKYG